MKREFIGTMRLGKWVDITDPCYDAGTWCRMTTQCKQGKYYGYVDIVDTKEDWGVRVAKISIARTKVDIDKEKLEFIGSIGVDAGLAGFFSNKPDYNDEEWENFVNWMYEADPTQSGKYWALDDNKGLFSDSGFGDGQYNVYANKERTAFQIVFITQSEINRYHWD